VTAIGRPPVLWRNELRNLLAGYLRRKTLTFAQAGGIQREAEDLLAAGEFEVDSAAVLELVRDSDCSAYDCEFVALAMKLQVKLITMDAKLLNACPKHAVSLAADHTLRVTGGTRPARPAVDRPVNPQVRPQPPALWRMAD